MEPPKKTILVFLKYYLPGYKAGGPIRSVSNLVDWCGDTFNFKIITGDRDQQEPEPFANIKLNDWNRVGKADVFYIKEQDITPFYILKLLKNTDYDFIYFNSFFRAQFSIMPLLLLKYVVRFKLNNVLLAPRGEFSQGALEIKSFKKRAFIRLAKQLGIYNRINWQATDETERENIRKTIGISDERIVFAPNLPQKISTVLPPNNGKERGVLRLIYLSRITPKKNLLYALESVSKLKNTRVVFDIYGQAEDRQYWAKCRELIDTMGEHVHVNFKDVIPHNQVLETVAGYDLFFLPTKGENYGHAIYESFLAGTPVLISDQTPWSNLTQKGLGWDIRLDNEQAYVDVLNEVAIMDAAAMKQKKEGVKQAINEMDIQKNVQQNKQVLKQLVS